MAFLDASKGMTGTIPADSPLNASIWLVSVLRNYMFKRTIVLIKPNLS
jgi:hypothetical protein